MMIEAKVLRQKEGVFTLPRALRMYAGDAAGERGAAVFAALVQDSGIAAAVSPDDAVLRFEPDALLRGEAYRLTVTPQGVTAAYGSEAGARNAAVTLYNGIEKRGEAYGLPCCEAEDWPDAEFRAVLIDLARKYHEPQSIKDTLRQMALAKMNKAIFHLLDTQHYAMHSDAVPELNGGKFRQYTKAQMRELVEYAAFWGIEAIPDLDLPGHAIHMLDSLPQLACEVDDDEGGFKPSKWAVCVGAEETYAVAEKLYQEVYTVFDSGYMQLCGDELAFWDLGYWANWEHCARCKALARREGFSEKGFTGYFYYFVRRIHDILARMGKRVILSNDNVDIAVSPDLPRDMLIFWWRTAAPGRGPIEGCTMKRFAEEGFDLFNSFYEETYIDLYMTGEKLADWNPVKRPDCPPEYAYRVKGSCLCAWEGQAHFAWSLPSGIAMMGEKLWDYRDRVYDEVYHQKLTRLLLGPDVPAGLDIFTPLGGCFFPLDGDMPAEKARRGHPDKVDASMLPRLEETMAALRPFAEGGHRESPLAAVYLECLGWMREQLTNPPADPA